MTYLIMLAIYVGILFLVAWTSRRSMGVPTIALAAGALIANLWTNSLTPVVANAGVVIVSPPLASIVSIVLTILPALLVMLRSHKVSSHYRSIVGGLVFAVLGVLLTYGAFSNAVVLDDASKQYVLTIVKYQNVAITTCIALAIVEVLFYRKPHGREHKAHHE